MWGFRDIVVDLQRCSLRDLQGKAYVYQERHNVVAWSALKFQELYADKWH
jgi:hypothetical protein